MLEELTRLARDRAPARREALLAAVIDLYRAAGARAELALGEVFSDIVVYLVACLPDTAKPRAGALLADLETAPHALVLRLAAAGGPLAAPLLQSSPVLSDDDLVALVARLDEPGLAAVAARAGLSERVTDALVAEGGPALCRAVAANRSARLSRTCLARIVAACGEGAAELRGAADVIPFTPPPRRKRASRRPGFGKPRVIAFPKRADHGAEPVAAPPPVAEAIAAIASHDRMLEVAMLLAAHAGLPPDLVSRLIARPDPTLLAVLCRAAGVPDSTFSVIARIRGRRFGHPLAQTLAVEAAYAELSEAEARQRLGSVKAMQKKA